MFKPKVRIKYLEPNGAVVDERLVTQSIEFTNGPTSVHKGPLSIEVTLVDSGDIDAFTEYLKRLRGELPLPEKRTYKKTGPSKEVAPVEEMLKELLTSSKIKTQDDMIKYLRERNFVFMSLQQIEDIGLEITIKPEHSTYQFMVRKTREGKSVKSDRYDPQLAVGMRIMGERVDKIRIYLYGQYDVESSKVKKPWAKETDINFKKIKPKVFPHYMTHEERDKFREEERKMALNPEHNPSKFYLRWADAVKKATAKAHKK